MKKPSSDARPLARLLRDPQRLVQAAGLHYSCDAGGGLRRERAGEDFDYFDVQGRPVRDPELLERIRALAIPPAWTDVWICTDPRGHLQATGRDTRGRKQYRYHSLWRALSNQTKFFSLIAFAEALPALRRRVAADLARPGLDRQRVLAVAVRLLETTLIRIGNEEYARENESYGLTTMHDDHVEIEGATLRFKFRGKSGVYHEIKVTDRRLAGLVRRCRDLPGYELFQYLDEAGEPQPIDSADVNEYLAAVTGQEFSAKHFRTWGGTVAAGRALQAAGPAASETEGKRVIVQTVKEVAHLLGNRPATCRNYYIHPAIPEFYLRGELSGFFARQAGGGEPAGLSAEERAVLEVLREDFRRAAGRVDELARRKAA